MVIKLEEIVPKKAQILCLFALLEERVHRISHRSMPSFEEHEKFVKTHPYRSWFIVFLNDEAIGSVYVQYDNSIGFNCSSVISAKEILVVLNEVRQRISPLEKILSLRPDHYFINVASSDKEFQKKLMTLGFTETQRTFVDAATQMPPSR